jgi:hypothetical protein
MKLFLIRSLLRYPLRYTVQQYTKSADDGQDNFTDTAGVQIPSPKEPIPYVFQPYKGAAGSAQQL